MSLMISLKRIPVPTVTAHSKNPYVHFYFLRDSKFIRTGIALGGEFT